MIYRKDYTFIMSEKLPEGKSGDYILSKRTSDKGALIRMYSPTGFLYHDTLGFSMHTVSLLKDGGGLLMSDTPLEQESLRVPVIAAHGKTLVIGLGIGLFPTLLRMRNQSVKSILIVEQSRDVAKLVYHHVKNRRTTLLVRDGKEYLSTCEEKFDFIFIDVWSTFTTTIKEIDEWTKLARPCLAEGGDVRCWLQELYDQIKDKLPKKPTERTSPAAVHEPCLVCGKKLRYDYAGLCMDCADDLELSEAYVRRDKPTGLPLTAEG